MKKRNILFVLIIALTTQNAFAVNTAHELQHDKHGQIILAAVDNNGAILTLSSSSLNLTATYYANVEASGEIFGDFPNDIESMVFIDSEHIRVLQDGIARTLTLDHGNRKVLAAPAADIKQAITNRASRANKCNFVTRLLCCCCSCGSHFTTETISSIMPNGLVTGIEWLREEATNFSFVNDPISYIIDNRKRIHRLTLPGNIGIRSSVDPGSLDPAYIPHISTNGEIAQFVYDKQTSYSKVAYWSLDDLRRPTVSKNILQTLSHLKINQVKRFTSDGALLIEISHKKSEGETVSEWGLLQKNGNFYSFAGALWPKFPTDSAIRQSFDTDTILYVHAISPDGSKLLLEFYNGKTYLIDLGEKSFLK